MASASRFGCRTIQLVVIRLRVGVDADQVSVNKGRPVTRTAVLCRSLECTQARHGIGAVHLVKVEIREIRNQPRNVSARCIHLNRDADRIAVVFDHENDRQLAIRGRVQRLPELTLRSRALAYRGENHFIAVEGDIAKGAVIALNSRRSSGMAREVPSRLSATHRMQNLRRRR